ncbi:MAG: hypothetical protein HC881_07975, partial [Leptolyngbyaceae cyanobacterium SL_7_1]|nr:hypothetical protein [Leptolyngbyaceae cyanobacterium SL_7_1]
PPPPAMAADSSGELADNNSVDSRQFQTLAPGEIPTSPDDAPFALAIVLDVTRPLVFCPGINHCHANGDRR